MAINMASNVTRIQRLLIQSMVNAFVSNIMPRTSCEKLSQYMHCSMAAMGDKLSMVRPIITLCEQSFARCFVPSQNISVDEATIQRTTIKEGNERAIVNQFCRFDKCQALQRYMFNYSIFLIVFYKFVMLLVRKSKPETRYDSEGVAVDMARAATET